MVNGAPLIAFVTEPRRREICARLSSVGFDVEEACDEQQLRLLDARTTLDRILVADTPDPDCVRAVLGFELTHAVLGAPGRQTRVFGELVDVLWRDGKVDAALRLE